MSTITIDTQHLPNYLLLLLYILTGSISNFGAIDILAPQWIYLGSLNMLTCLYFLVYSKNDVAKSLSVFITTTFFVIYIFYFIWNALSYFYAVNPTETIINLPRVGNTFFAIFFCFLLLYNLPKKFYFISRLFVFFLTAELLAYYNDFNNVFPKEGLRVILIKGFAGNKNITAASIAFKLPFVMYLLYTSKKILFKLFHLVLFTFGLLSVSLIEARAAILSTLIVSVLFLSYQIYLLIIKRKTPKQSFFDISLTLLPYLIALLINFSLTTTAKKGTITDTVGRIAFTEESSNGRFQYWGDAWDYFKKNPVLGSGLGNWKIASIGEGKEHINGYTVPYHAHNDFIHVFTETGLLGGLAYLGLFLCLTYYLLNLLYVKFRRKGFLELQYFILILPLIIYVLDAALNFPVARPLMQSSLAIFSALVVTLYLDEKAKKSKKVINITSFYQKLILGTVLLLLIPGIIIHVISFNSLKKQGLLLYEFNNAQYNMTIDQLEEISHDFPNLTETAMPIKSMKARYYYLNNQKEKAFKLAEEGIKDNPEIFFSENLLSLFHYQEGNYDKAFQYAKIAFDGLPNNMPHYDMMMKICAVLKKYDEIDNTFKKVMDYQYDNGNLKLIWTIYIRTLAQTRGTGDPHALSKAVEAYNLFPEDTSLSLFYRLLTYGETTVSAAAAAYQKGTELYNSQKYNEAAEYFKTAVDFDAIEKTYSLNAGLAYFEAKKYEPAIKYFDLVIAARHNEKMIERALRYKAISLYNYNQKGRACAIFLKLADQFPKRMYRQEFNKYCRGGK